MRSSAIKKPIAVFLFMSMALLCQGVANCTENRMSESTSKRLEIIHRLMERGDKKEALTRLQQLEEKVKKKKYERTFVYFTFAYLFSSTDEVNKAIDYFNRSLEEGVLPAKNRRDALINLARLYAIQQQYQQSAEWFERWLAEASKANEKKVDGTGLMIGAGSYSVLGEHALAIQYARRAIASLAENSSVSREPWVLFLVAELISTKSYKASIPLLIELININPGKKSYWVTLASVYQMIGDNQTALTVYRSAYARGVISTQNEVLNMVSLYLSEGLPYKAVTTLREMMDKKILEKNDTVLGYLYQAYVDAKMLKQASVVQDERYQLTGKAEILIDAVQLLVELEEWKMASEYLARLPEAARDAAGGPFYFLSGVVNYELQDFARARQMFWRASRYSEYEKNAAQWVSYLERKMY